MWRLLRHYLEPCFLFLFLHFQVIFASSFNSSPSGKLCFPEESFALIHFKNTFSINSSASSFCGGHIDSSSYPKTESWKESDDCCLWDGVTCDRFTGHVVGLDLSSSWLLGTVHSNSSLFLLHHLQKLNLACNDFSGSNFSSKFGQFMKLTHLNLSSSNLCGLVPTEIFHLSKLASLDLSSNSYVGELRQHDFNKLLHNLTELRYLHLDGVNMSSVVPISLVNLSSSLISLSLSSVALQGEFPNEIFHLPFLQKLILSGNIFLSGNLPKANWSSPLRLLDLSSTLFSGMLYDTIGNLTYLNELDLGACNFEGSIPTSLWNLTGITVLELGDNNFSGKVSASLSNLGQLTDLNLAENKFSGQFPDVFGNLRKLTYVVLQGNDFSGQLPSSAFNHLQLSHLVFSENQFEGHVPSQVSGKPSFIRLDLSNNKLTGPVPNSIFENMNITYLDLSSNNLSGTVKSNMFSKLKNLLFVDLSYNNLLSLTDSNDNFTLPNLSEFRFSSCNLTEFPFFLRNIERLEILDLSNNSISGQISQWDFEKSRDLMYLDLSSNFLTGFEYIPQMINLKVLNLQSNLLQGSLVVPPTLVNYFSVSNNRLTGEVPQSYCNLSFISHLDLSNNSLIGTIPQCIGNYNMLLFLDLRMNNFYGSIPQMLAQGHIQYLNLNGNELEGPLPPSWVNCSMLKLLDVGNNMITDKFPHSLATLPELRVLILKSNKFHGPIGSSTTRFAFPMLQILDLSHNQFTGLLPTTYFKNFKAMMHSNVSGTFGDNYLREYTGYYRGLSAFRYYSTSLTVKGVTMEMERILTIFTAMDLSNNKFQGQIPEILGKFSSLELLNFSHNNLTGHIPPSLGNLSKLEALDLSSNMLVGEIPKQLTHLTSLSILNLSYNQLRGLIPQGPQFNTFSNDSYIGNLGLCEFPLSKKCSNDDAPEPAPAIFHEEENNESWFDWKIIMMGYGSGLVIGLSIGYILFATRKPHWFIRMVEREQSTKMRRLNKRREGTRNQ